MIKVGKAGPGKSLVFRMGATKIGPGESRLWAVFGGLFTSSRSSPMGPYSKGQFSLAKHSKELAQLTPKDVPRTHERVYISLRCHLFSFCVLQWIDLR